MRCCNRRVGVLLYHVACHSCIFLTAVTYFRDRGFCYWLFYYI